MAQIATIAAAIELIELAYKSAIWVQRTRHRWRGKSPLDTLPKGEVMVVLSSLLSTPPDLLPQMTPFLKPWEKTERGDFMCIPVSGGFLATGVTDSFALAELAIALAKRKRDFQFRLDDLSGDDRAQNLILMGSPTSNLVSRDLYKDFLPPFIQNRFCYDDSFSTMFLDNVVIQGGQFGLVAKIANPWDPECSIIWVAGIGPAGTGGAVRFAIADFDEKTPQNVKKAQQWLLLVEAQVDKHGYIVDASYYGGVHI